MNIEVFGNRESVAQRAASIIAGEAWEAVAARGFFVVTGSEKAEMVNRLLDGDRSIPAGRIRSSRARILADRAAAPLLLATREGATRCA